MTPACSTGAKGLRNMQNIVPVVSFVFQYVPNQVLRPSTKLSTLCNRRCLMNGGYVPTGMYKMFGGMSGWGNLEDHARRISRPHRLVMPCGWRRIAYHFGIRWRVVIVPGIVRLERLRWLLPIPIMRIL